MFTTTSRIGTASQPASLYFSTAAQALGGGVTDL
jgi:hypothetical protein